MQRRYDDCGPDGWAMVVVHLSVEIDWMTSRAILMCVPEDSPMRSGPEVGARLRRT